MAERGRSSGPADRRSEPADPATESAEMRALRGRIDALDRRIVQLLNERAELGLAVGRAKAVAGRSVRDGEREAEVLARVAGANGGPLPEADLLALYRRLVAATRRLELAERRRAEASGAGRARAARRS